MPWAMEEDTSSISSTRSLVRESDTEGFGRRDLFPVTRRMKERRERSRRKRRSGEDEEHDKKVSGSRNGREKGARKQSVGRSDKSSRAVRRSSEVKRKEEVRRQPSDVKHKEVVRRPSALARQQTVAASVATLEKTLKSGEVPRAVVPQPRAPPIRQPRSVFSEGLKASESYRQLDENNPFHQEYNKVISNPWSRGRRLSLGTLTSEEPQGVVRLGDDQWSFGGGSLRHSRETVNTAVVDIYQDGQPEEPLQKTRVRIWQCLAIIQDYLLTLRVTNVCWSEP